MHLMRCIYPVDIQWIYICIGTNIGNLFAHLCVMDCEGGEGVTCEQLGWDLGERIARLYKKISNVFFFFSKSALLKVCFSVFCKSVYFPNW